MYTRKIELSFMSKIFLALSPGEQANYIKRLVHFIIKHNMFNGYIEYFIHPDNRKKELKQYISFKDGRFEFGSEEAKEKYSLTDINAKTIRPYSNGFAIFIEVIEKEYKLLLNSAIRSMEKEAAIA